MSTEKEAPPAGEPQRVTLADVEALEAMNADADEVRKRLAALRKRYHLPDPRDARIATLEADLADARKQLEAEAAKRAEGEKLAEDRRVLAIEESEARLGAEQNLTSLATLAAALVEALPSCADCDAPQTLNTYPPLCDGDSCGHNVESEDVDYAAPLRALLAKLAELRAGETSASEPAGQPSSRGDAPKTAALFLPEIVNAITCVEFGEGSHKSRNGWGAFKDEDSTWFVIPRGLTPGRGNELVGITREQAIRRAFDLSRAAAGKGER